MERQVNSSPSSSQRPIPLVARPDLIAERIRFRGVDHWVVKNPVGLRYFRLRPEQYRVLTLLDGQRSLEELREELLADFPAVPLRLTDVVQVIVDLYDKGLAYSNRPGQGLSLLEYHRRQRWKKFLSALWNVLYVRLPGWDPYVTLNALYPLVRWLFHPVVVAMTALAAVYSWGLFLAHFGDVRTQLPEFDQFFGWPNLIYLWLTMAAVKVLHEFGHGFTCKHFGGECHAIGVMLLVFSPTLYCDVSDSWMLRSKWRRIAIGGAGMYVETVLSALAIYLWRNTQPGLLHHLSLNVFFVTTVSTIIFNANPLMRFDGYYMLADLLEIPNLRPRADKLLRDAFAWYCLGIESPPDPFMPDTRRFWFVTFAIAAWLYRWIVLFGIALFLYTVLKPYELQSIGIMLAVVSVGASLFGIVYQICQLLRAPRNEPMSRMKAALTVLTASAAIGVMLMVPIPVHVQATFTVEPQGVRDVFTTVPGELVSVDVEPGQYVNQGQVLARLRNSEKEEECIALKTDERVQQAEINVQHALENPSQRELAVRKLESIREQLAEYEHQLKRLTIVAPCSGYVVAPPRTPEPKAEQFNFQLGAWFGTPLDRRNGNAYLEAATHLASIGPDGSFSAVLLIDQSHRPDIAVGQDVEFKLEHLPGRTYRGTVEEISKRHVEFAPAVLSNKHGGELPTVSDPQGRERLTSIAYQAKVRLDEDAPLLLSGMRGRARFLVDSHTAGEWIWRYLRRTFHFRL